jgi:curved DNA-binding protein CbpA
MQGSEEQLHQAHADRSLQLPRLEYSEVAIAARKSLLDLAYEVLSDPHSKAEYDLQFLETPQENETPIESEDEASVPQTDDSPKSVPELNPPWLDIGGEQLIGALLIFQELGAYDRVIEFGYPLLNSLEQKDTETLKALKSDVLLTLALANLEVSREQWHRGEYENAAESGMRGLALLEPEKLFFSVRDEISTELYKLRPYRILELLSLSQERSSERRKGLKLLQEMLQERDGIDGKGDDRSGLDIDDCLRFIQQIRIYLTAQEQQELFEAEAERPSAVAKYLAIYALIARGFGHKQPELIVRATILLEELSKRQDVHLEQAACYLLLGQTEKASLALEGSHEEEAIEFIRQQSQGEPDLLRGLCAYEERWLQTEVFSHFRDLKDQKASLKDYFADREVQTYLEQLALDENQDETTIENDEQQTTGETMPRTRATKQSSLQGQRTTKTGSYYDEPQPLAKTYSGRTATLPLAPTNSRYERGAVNFKENAEETQEISRERMVVTGYRQPLKEAPRRRRKRSNPPNGYRQAPQHPSGRKPKSRAALKRRRLLVGIVALLGLGASGLALNHWFQESRSPLAALQGEQLAIGLANPPLAIPPAGAQIIPSIAAVLTQQGAEQVIQNWLASKSQAFGEQHQVESLDKILTGSLRSQWRDRAQKLKNSKDYWQYKHELQVQSLKTDTQKPDRATVEASVRETANYYQNGQIDRGRSYDENLQVRYELVRQGDLWLIQAIQVIN